MKSNADLRRLVRRIKAEVDSLDAQFLLSPGNTDYLRAMVRDLVKITGAEK